MKKYLQKLLVVILCVATTCSTFASHREIALNITAAVIVVGVGRQIIYWNQEEILDIASNQDNRWSTIAKFLLPIADIDKSEALIKAVLFGKIKRVQFLIEQGVDINKKGAYEITALMYAVEKENVDIVQLLLDYGADADTECDSYFYLRSTA